MQCSNEEEHLMSTIYYYLLKQSTAFFFFFNPDKGAGTQERDRGKTACTSGKKAYTTDKEACTPGSSWRNYSLCLHSSIFLFSVLSNTTTFFFVLVKRNTTFEINLYHQSQIHHNKFLYFPFSCIIAKRQIVTTPTINFHYIQEFYDRVHRKEKYAGSLQSFMSLY